MNATLKAREIQHKYEADGWSFGVTWQPTLGCYRVNYGQKPSGGTVFNNTAYVYLHSNGNVGHVEYRQSEGTGLAVYSDWPYNGAYAGNIEVFVRSLLFAYAAAWPGSRAAVDNYLPDERIVRA